MADIKKILEGLPSNWYRWGSEDELGTLNVLNASEVLRGIASVQTGKVFTLGLPIGSTEGDLVWPGRTPTKHYMVADKSHFVAAKQPAIPGTGGVEYADDVVHMYLQGTTQVDALGHIWYDNTLYNGYDAMTTTAGLARNGVEHMAAHGMVGSAVLLDVARYLGLEALPKGYEITLAELLATAKEQAVEVQPHDFLILRTGYYLNYVRGGVSGYLQGELNEPGVTLSKELATWFYQMCFPVFATDTMGNEQTHSTKTGTKQPLHPYFITRLGMTLLEMAWLEDLALDCATDGQYRFLMVVSPLKFLGGAGSPVNPIVVK